VTRQSRASSTDTSSGSRGWSARPSSLAVNGFRDQARARARARAREMLYVGLSRARDLLVVCGDLELIRRVGGEAVARRLSASGEG
jgi:ATP-dependent exoDNAse (exonuclease V) beta subunit